MIVSKTHNHRNASKILVNKQKILDEIFHVLNDSSIILGRINSTLIKNKINYKFNHLGWADRVRVGNSNLTIGFVKSKVGVCFQIGNVARTYADILKLMQLHKMGVIETGIIIVPDKEESKKMGANRAQFERLEKELMQFQEVIHTPILLIGIKNK